MKVAIVDDELMNRLVIRKIVKGNCPWVDIVVDEELIDNAVASINAARPDVVFLDIRLKNGTGFDIMRELEYKPRVIFTTAYSEYAIKAFKVQAFDYLLKPIDENELIDSLERCRQLMVKAELQEPREEKTVQGFYSYATSSGKTTISFDEINYFEGSGAYTFIITRDDKILLSKNIGEIEKEVPASLFYRTHNSYIVNVKKIKSVDAKRSGQITLMNDDVIPLSQRKAKEFLELLKT